MDETINLPKIYLHPSNLFVNKKPHIVSTVLGSCVSVCLWDQTVRAGGINHYMLPLWNGEGLQSPRYGNIAIAKLIEKMLSIGCKRSNLKAKVFGGASINQVADGNFLNIGERNIIIARDVLAEEGVSIVSSDVGGKYGRRLIFFTETGKVKIKIVQPSRKKRYEKNKCPYC